MPHEFHRLSDGAAASHFVACLIAGMSMYFQLIQDNVPKDHKIEAGDVQIETCENGCHVLTAVTSYTTLPALEAAFLEMSEQEFNEMNELLGQMGENDGPDGNGNPDPNMN